MLIRAQQTLYAFKENTISILRSKFIHEDSEKTICTCNKFQQETQSMSWLPLGFHNSFPTNLSSTALRQPPKQIFKICNRQAKKPRTTNTYLTRESTRSDTPTFSPVTRKNSRDMQQVQCTSNFFFYNQLQLSVRQLPLPSIPLKKKKTPSLVTLPSTWQYVWEKTKLGSNLESWNFIGFRFYRWWEAQEELIM